MSTSGGSDPLTDNTRSGLSTSSPMAVIVTTPVLDVSPGAKVRSRLELQSKLTPACRWLNSTVAVTTTTSLDGWLNCAVTVLTPPSSGIFSGVRTREMTGGASSSSMVNVTPPAGSTARPVASVVPLTITVRSGSSTLLFSGTRSKVAVALASPVAIVMSKLVTAEKSVPSTAVPAATDTVTTVSPVRDAPSSAAVTVTVRSEPAASSEIRSGETVSVAFVDGDSSSVIVSVCASGDVTPWSFIAVPDTVTSLSSSSSLLSTPVIVTVPVLVLSPAATASTVVPLRVKSSSCVGDTGVADTVIVVSSLDGRSRVAVTVLSPASSEIDAGVRTRVTTGAGSSSTMVTVSPDAGATLRPDAVVAPVTVTVSSGSSVASSIGASTNVSVALVSRAAIVTVKPVTAA